MCAVQCAKVRDLIAQGHYETALAEAKSYYDVAELVKTKAAIKVMTTALVKARGRAIANQFRREQSPDALTLGKPSVAAPEMAFYEPLRWILLLTKRRSINFRTRLTTLRP